MLLLLSAMSLGLVETTVEYDQSQRLRDAAVLLGATGGDSGAISPGLGDQGDNDTTNPFRSVAPGDWTIVEPDCSGAWRRPNQHLYFQLGNACFFLAFLATSGAGGQLWLRSMLCCGCVLLVLWGWMVECSSDAVLWSGIFLVVNAVYAVVLVVRLRPVRFDKELEAVYGALFRPLKVTRLQFRKVLACMRVVRALKYQEVYAQEKVTKVDSLSLVLSGKLVVSQAQRALHIVFAHQFLDSPEWFGVSTDDYFQVSIMAMEDSRVLIWHRDKLKLSIMSEPFLETVFDHILGRDVVKKLMQVTQVSETMAASNGCLAPGSTGNGSIYDDLGGANAAQSEDKQPMLLMRKNGSADNNGHGITALINRQLQDEQSPLLSTSPSPQQQQFLLLRSDSREHLRDSSPTMVDIGDHAGYHEDEDEDEEELSLGTNHRTRHRGERDLKTSMSGDPNAWRLGRIDENDHETAV